MSRRRHFKRRGLGKLPFVSKRARKNTSSGASRLSVEPLEARYMLSANANNPLSDTFILHSNDSATKKIYLDFDGDSRIINSTWNAQTGLPNIIALGFDADGNAFDFSDAEKLTIQHIWE